jgi:hypothetical protein
MDLHIIDGELNPDPMTINGTKDLVEVFWALKKLPHPPPLAMTIPTPKPRQTKRCSCIPTLAFETIFHDPSCAATTA